MSRLAPVIKEREVRARSLVETTGQRLEYLGEPPLDEILVIHEAVHLGPFDGSAQSRSTTSHPSRKPAGSLGRIITRSDCRLSRSASTKAHVYANIRQVVDSAQLRAAEVNTLELGATQIGSPEVSHTPTSTSGTDDPSASTPRWQALCAADQGVDARHWIAPASSPTGRRPSSSTVAPQLVGVALLREMSPAGSACGTATGRNRRSLPNACRVSRGNPYGGFRSAARRHTVRPI